jgi:hypothetical protein
MGRKVRCYTDYCVLICSEKAFCQSFIKEHRREGTFSVADESFTYLSPFTSSTFFTYSPASVERAIFWLKEGQKHGEDQDGAVSAALAKMYGINKQCVAMQEALKKAISVAPAWKERLCEPNSLILLANGRIDESNIQLESFEDLSEKGFLWSPNKRLKVHASPRCNKYWPRHVSSFARVNPLWEPRRSIVGLTLAVNLAVRWRLAWHPHLM